MNLSYLPYGSIICWRGDLWGGERGIYEYLMPESAHGGSFECIATNNIDYLCTKMYQAEFEKESEEIEVVKLNDLILCSHWKYKSRRYFDLLAKFS